MTKSPESQSSPWKKLERTKSAEIIDPELKGVGGWLLLFVIGQLVCSPLRVIGELGSPDMPSLSEIVSTYPQTAYILSVNRVLSIAMLAFGVSVAVMLLTVKNAKSVSITRLYLITGPVVAGLSTYLYWFTDLPSTARSQIIGDGIRDTIAIGIACLIWLMYFAKSKRVRTTYFGNQMMAVALQREESNDGEDIWACDKCQQEVSTEAKICPHCGADVSEVR